MLISYLTALKPENNRLDSQYWVLRCRFDQRDFFAPLKDPRRILDIGTGTGVWCISVGLSPVVSLPQIYQLTTHTGEMFPKAEVQHPHLLLFSTH